MVTTDEMSVVATKIRVDAQMRLNAEALTGVSVDAYLDVVVTDLVAVLCATLYGVEHDPFVVRYPSDWVEAAKERWMPSWAMRWWPVRYYEVRVEPRTLFPAAVVPGERRSIYIRQGDV